MERYCNTKSYCRISKFSNLQVESNLPVAQKASMVVGIAGTVTQVIDFKDLRVYMKLKL